MPSSDNIRIGRRLKKARELLGLNLSDIGNKIFNHYQTLSNIEKGERPIKVSELVKLCKVYHKDSSYFIMEEEPKEIEYKFAWRDKNEEAEDQLLKAKIKKLIENYKLLEVLNDEELVSNSDFFSKDTPINSWEQAKTYAETIIRDYNLGYRPSKNLPNLLENKFNLRLLYYDLEDYCSGAKVEDENSTTIIINRFDVPGRRNFDLAHEFFHFIYTKIEPTSKDNQRVEQLANKFAAALLMPSKAVKEEFSKRVVNDKISYIDLISIAIEFEVSTYALLIKLRELNLLKQTTLDKLLKSEELKLLDKRKREGTNTPASSYSSRFIRLGVKALKDGKISKGKFCDIFSISRSQFTDFLYEKGYSEEYLYSNEIEINYT